MREAKGLGKSALARLAGVSASAVTQWESGETKQLKGPVLVRVAAALGVHPEEIATDKPLKHTGDSAGNTSTGPEIKGRVPLISWVQAGDFSHVVDNHHPGDAEEWIETTVPIHRHTYALRVRGDSMTNPAGAPSFPHGTVVVVEPDAIDAPEKLVGSYVIVRQNGDEECTFKQLVKDAGRFYLKPLNPQYRMLELATDAIICGVVRSVEMRFF